MLQCGKNPLSSIRSDATGLDILWFGMDKPKSKLDPV